MSIFSDLGIREGKDRLGEAVMYNIAACYSLVERKVSSVLAPHNLSPVKINALLIIKHVGGEKGLPQNQISKRMIVTAGNITRLLDRLEKDGLIKRISLKKDRRVKLVSISFKGSKLLDDVWPAYKEAIDNLALLLSEQELTATTKNLETLRKRLEK